MFTPQDLEVFVLTHKRPEMLRQTLDCYLNQTVQGFRLAVLGNGVDADTESLVASYAKHGVEDLSYSQNLGSCGNFIRASQTANRKLLILAHDDDLIHPSYVEYVLKAFNKYPQARVLASSLVLLEDTEKIKRTENNDKSLVFKLNNARDFAFYFWNGYNLAFSSCCIRTEVLTPPLQEDTQYFGKQSDIPWLINMTGNGLSLVLEFPFIQYRRHGGQDSTDFASGPTATQWINTELFYTEKLGKNIFTPQGRSFYLNSFHRLKRHAWKDWLKFEHDKMTFKSFLRRCRQAGATTRGALFWGTLIRGALHKKLMHLNFYLQKDTLD